MCDAVGKKTAKALGVKQSTPLNVTGKFGDPKAPEVPDAAAEALKAQNDKQSLINAELARQKKGRRGSALSTGAPSDLSGGGAGTTTYGKTTTGG
jgi:hypothetical protein